MKERVTKKHVNELLNIIKKEGYWSESVKQYLSKFTYDAMKRLDTKVKIQLRSEA